MISWIFGILATGAVLVMGFTMVAGAEKISESNMSPALKVIVCILSFVGVVAVLAALDGC
ncbi:MAG: hypothetical protein GXY61_06235 [Lentisphaerae bacterium]|nr:hypothetical protein [Lentisphaerota bacterium]